MKQEKQITEQQAMDNFSLMIIRHILNGKHLITIIDELVSNNVPRKTAQKIVQNIASQLVAQK